MLDLSLMKELEIDPDTRIAWAETGLTAGELTAAAGAHGLALSLGDTGSVGIGGLTLGGGIGYAPRAEAPVHEAWVTHATSSLRQADRGACVPRRGSAAGGDVPA